MSRPAEPWLTPRLSIRWNEVSTISRAGKAMIAAISTMLGASHGSGSSRRQGVRRRRDAPPAATRRGPAAGGALSVEAVPLMPVALWRASAALGGPLDLVEHAL